MQTKGVRRACTNCSTNNKRADKYEGLFLQKDRRWSTQWHVRSENRAGVGWHCNCSSSVARTLPCHEVAITDRQSDYLSVTQNGALFYWKDYRQTKGKNWQYHFCLITHHAMIHTAEWRYITIHSWSKHWIEVSGQPHTTTGLTQLKTSRLPRTNWVDSTARLNLFYKKIHCLGKRQIYHFAHWAIPVFSLTLRLQN
jgi:hypothetical protein